MGKRPEAERRGERYVQGGWELAPSWLQNLCTELCVIAETKSGLGPRWELSVFVAPSPWGLTLCLAPYMACEKALFAW